MSSHAHLLFGYSPGPNIPTGKMPSHAQVLFGISPEDVEKAERENPEYFKQLRTGLSVTVDRLLNQ